LVLSLLSGVIVAGCSSTKTSESTGQYIDNSAITLKVKTKLLADDQVKSLPISVESYKGKVELSGFVNNEKQRTRAVAVAKSVPGVVSVKDGLVVKSH
jgi:hyperosmotically inducible protein